MFLVADGSDGNGLQLVKIGQFVQVQGRESWKNRINLVMIQFLFKESVVIL